MTMTHSVLAIPVVAMSVLCMLRAPLSARAAECSMGEGSAGNVAAADPTTLIQKREAVKAVKAMDFHDSHKDGHASETERGREMASPPGAPWTAVEIKRVKKKLRNMMQNPAKAISEANIQVEKADRYGPSPARVVRLVFGTGGCDGCLDWQGVGRRSLTTATTTDFTLSLRRSSTSTQEQTTRAALLSSMPP